MVSHRLNIFSLNVGMSNTLGGLPSLVSVENLDIIFLQEIRMTGAQIENQLPGFHAIVNVDEDNIYSPGTAIAWRTEIPLQDVTPFIPCECNLLL